MLLCFGSRLLNPVGECISHNSPKYEGSEGVRHLGIVDLGKLGFFVSGERVERTPTTKVVLHRHARIKTRAASTKLSAHWAATNKLTISSPMRPRIYVPSFQNTFGSAQGESKR